jgi:predicted Zn-dependent protease
VPLIEQGRFADWLVSPTTAREYGLTSNAAGAYESPDALVMSPGNLSDTQALQALGTGISLANLWYLNFSDRQACRLTGMTRFACLWVEDAEPVGPIEAMRFDDSLFEMLGDRLEALGDTLARMPATDTYDGRATGGVAAPGALVSAMRFAL